MVPTGKKAPSKTEVLTSIANKTGLAKKEVAAVLEALADQIQKSLGSRGPGVFAIPGLVKIEKRKIPAKPARFGVPNPFKPGELMDVPAKAACTKVKVRALKNLKAMA
jgi:nucleoid DNA-binding protein